MWLYKLINRLGLPRFEHIYVQASPWEIPYRGKQGVSVDGCVRCKQIAESIERTTGQRIELRTWAKAPVLFPYKCERLIHRILDVTAWKYNGFKGSDGGTEWWIGGNAITFLIFIALLWFFDVSEPLYKAVFVLIVPAPLDQILLVYTVFLIQWAFILSGIGFLVWMAL